MFHFLSFPFNTIEVMVHSWCMYLRLLVGTRVRRLLGHWLLLVESMYHHSSLKNLRSRVLPLLLVPTPFHSYTNHYSISRVFVRHHFIYAVDAAIHDPALLLID